jgi:predicted regulator of Ras-like GTPase activity (Roadblock/LC7/MglB family)
MCKRSHSINIVFKRSVFLFPLLFILTSCLGANKPRAKKLIPGPSGPAIVNMTPDNSYRSALNTITVTFSESVDPTSITTDSLVIVNGGTCDAEVTVAGTVNAVATFSISGVGDCTTGDTFSFRIDPATVTDLEGNAGSGSAVTKTYTFDDTPIAFASIVPTNSSTLIVGPTTITITMSEIIGTLQAGALSFTGLCGANVNTVATTAVASGSNITVTLAMTTPCADDDTLIINLDSTKVLDRAGNAGTVGVDDVATYTIDDDIDVVGPTVLSISPANGAVAALTSVVVTFSEDVDAATLTNASLVPTNGGTCDAAVTAVNVVNDVATFTVTGVASDCTDGDAFSFEIDPTTVDDLIGNAGTGSAATASYTYDNGPIAFSSISPATSTMAAAPATITITMTEAIGTFDPNAVTFAGTCAGDVDTGATTAVANGSDIDVSLVMITPCADGETLTIMLDDTLVEDLIGNTGVVGDTAVATYTISIPDVTGPTYVSINPATSTAASAPASITITMDEALGAVNAGAVTFAGTCAGDVDTGATTAVANGSDIDVSLVMITPCADGETLTIMLDDTLVEDLIGNTGVVGDTAVATYTISIADVTGPTYVGSSDSDGLILVMPIPVLTISEDIGAINAGAISFGGTCAPKMDVGATATVMLGTTDFEVQMSTTSNCDDGETLEVYLDMSKIEDVNGNPGTGGIILVNTYTFLVI